MVTSKYFGMSLNERLAAAGLLEQFSAAVQNKNETLMLDLLVKVEYTQAQARDTAKSLMLDPESYHA